MHGLLQSTTEFSVDTSDVVVRENGFVIMGTETRVNAGFSSSSGAIDITLVSRAESEQMYAYRCMKVNLSVMVCMDLITGTHVDHLTFSPQELTMFSTAHFDLVSDMDGGSPFGSEIVIRSAVFAVIPPRFIANSLPLRPFVIYMKCYWCCRSQVANSDGVPSVVWLEFKLVR